MSIEEFVSKFTDVIPYKFSIKIGGNRAGDIRIDKTKVSNKNYKGRIYPFYKKSIEGTTTNYIPMEEINVPVEISIQCDYPHRLKWEKISKTTNKEKVKFEVKLLKEKEDKQFGYLSLNLTPAGDLEQKFCCYYNEDGTHKIIQSVFYNFNQETKEVSTKENLSYIDYNLETGLEEKVEFQKMNGILHGVTMYKRKLKNPMYESIVFSQENIDEKEYMFSRCFSEKLLEYKNISCDIPNLIINEDFIHRRRRIKDLHDTINLEKEEENKYFLNYKVFKEELRELLNPKNDIFGGFVGNYVGNTILKKEGKILLIVETLKDNLHYFTQIDITNTDAFDIEFGLERFDGTLYYNAIRNASKMPMFRIKIENGEDVLIPFGETATKEEIQNYNEFKNYCVENFRTIQEKKLATLSFKSREIEQQGGPNLKRKKNFK